MLAAHHWQIALYLDCVLLLVDVVKSMYVARSSSFERMLSYVASRSVPAF